jgi:hypothetical protein
LVANLGLQLTDTKVRVGTIEKMFSILEMKTGKAITINDSIGNHRLNYFKDNISYQKGEPCPFYV